MLPTSPRLQGQKAINVLRVASAGVNAQTVTIGADVFELTTKDDLSVTAGRIAVDMTGGATRKAKAKLTFTGQPLDTETEVINGKTYTYQDDLTDVDGHVQIGADAEETIDNLVAAINRTPAGAGTQYATATTKHTTVTAAKSGTDKCILSAIIAGTPGNAYTLVDNATNVARDAATFGTEQLGVDPTASEVLTALETAINASNTQRLEADKISTTHLLVRSKDVKVVTLACTETLTGTNNAWASATMYGGATTKTHKMAHAKRVPNAVEVAVGALHFELPFTPTSVIVLVAPTATPGAWKIWDGVPNIDGGHVLIDNAGSVDWASTDTMEVLFIE
jgi:hypothetical protein